MRHQGFLAFGRYRYLRLSASLCLLAGAAYFWHRNYVFDTPGRVGYGGSWMGYALGTAAAVLVLWLLWLGVRKRRYRAATGTLQGWVSAHVYLGLAALLFATLHTGLEFGFNLHTLTYLLLLTVVFSGIYGVFVFVIVPSRMTSLMGEDSVQTLLLQLRDIDLQARRLALSLPDEFNALALDAAQGTRLRGTVFDHISRASSRGCPTELAVTRMQALNKALKEEQGRLGRELYALMLRRRTAVKKIRGEYRALARMRLWLLLHVPCSVALLFALGGHIVSVFIYG